MPIRGASEPGDLHYTVAQGETLNITADSVIAGATFSGDKSLLVIKTVGTLPDGLVEGDTPLWSYRATGPQSVVFYFQLSVPSQGGTYDSRLASVSIDVIPADAPITDTPIPEPPAGRGATSGRAERTPL